MLRTSESCERAVPMGGSGRGGPGGSPLPGRLPAWLGTSDGPGATLCRTSEERQQVREQSSQSNMPTANQSARL